jgi:germination protein M
MKLRTRHDPAAGHIGVIPILGALLLSVLVLGAALSLTGCGTGTVVGDGGPVDTLEETGTTTAEATTTTSHTDSTDTTASTSATSATTTTTAGETMTVSVYFIAGEQIVAEHRVLPKSESVGKAAVQALLKGPSAADKAAGVTSAIPDGTTYLGLDIADGVATIDLSKEYASGGGSASMAMRLAQMVFTLTQFPTIETVTFQLDGEAVTVFGGEGLILDHPVGRADYEELSPAILVEAPTRGDSAQASLRVWGTANVFEAVLNAKLLDAAGSVIAGPVTINASSGTGTRGTFDVTIPFSVTSSQNGTLVVYSDSPKDGSAINVTEIPVQLKK